MSKGKIIRVSDDVLKQIEKRRKRKKESMDSIMRRIFGIPDKKGRPQKLKTMYLVKNPNDDLVPWLGFEDKASVRGAKLILKQDNLKIKRVREMR